MSEHIQENRAHAANSVTEGGGGRALLSRRQLLLGAGGLAAVAPLTSSTGRVTRALAPGERRPIGRCACPPIRRGGAHVPLPA
jgi:hypothetical protein